MSTMMTESEGSKAAVPGVDRNDLHEIMVPVPTHNEQEVIARYLDRATAKIDALVARVRDGVDRLKEFRATLISAAVTGKIDVREA